MKALIGRKVGMSQLLREDGAAIPVTLIQAGPCPVIDIKTAERDGYAAVQMGYGSRTRLTKPLSGHVKNSKASPAVLREFRADEISDDLNPGDILSVANFEIGDRVRISGTSKGKGFAGNVKRHNFNTGPKTHGSSNYRRPGSIGSMYPQKIFKGKKMAGQMGGDRISLRDVTVELIDVDRNIVAVRGAVPGPRDSLIMIQGA